MQNIPYNESRTWSIGYDWETFFKQLPADTLSLYIFHTDTLAAYEWSIIRDQYKVLKRYDLSLQDLKNSNFTVTYP